MSGTSLEVEAGNASRTAHMHKRRSKPSPTAARLMADQMNVLSIQDTQPDDMHVNFREDFVRICAKRNIAFVPEIVQRPHPGISLAQPSATLVSHQDGSKADRRSQRALILKGPPMLKGSKILSAQEAQSTVSGGETKPIPAPLSTAMSKVSVTSGLPDSTDRGQPLRKMTSGFGTPRTSVPNLTGGLRRKRSSMLPKTQMTLGVEQDTGPARQTQSVAQSDSVAVPLSGVTPSSVAVPLSDVTHPAPFSAATPSSFALPIAPSSNPGPLPGVTPSAAVPLTAVTPSFAHAVSAGQRLHGETGKIRDTWRTSLGAVPDMTDNKPPTTFTTRTRLSYFKPCIQVEEMKTEGTNQVTEIYIRGWKVDLAMMEVFQQCWPMLQRLHTVNLWNVALDRQPFCLLTSFLPLCDRLHTLVLDANSLADLPVSLLIAEDSHLQHLSMRFCGLTDIEAYGIGHSLGSHSTCNMHLLTLNLSNNHITDVGVGHIAEGLKINRTLLTLNLASNRFGDDGAARMSAALSFFPLSQEQLIQRRMLLSRKLEKENVRPGSLLGDGQLGSTGRSPSIKDAREGKDKDNWKRTKEPKWKSKAAQISAKRKVSSVKPDAIATKRDTLETPRLRMKRHSDSRMKPLKLARLQRSSTEETDFQSDECCSTALTDFCQLQDGQLWLLGNRTLISLNLSRNRIGVLGMRQLLEAVEGQLNPPAFSQNQPSPGLRRLVLHRNAVSEHDASLKAIQHHMRLKDPLFKSPVMDISKPSITPCSIPLFQ